MIKYLTIVLIVICFLFPTETHYDIVKPVIVITETQPTLGQLVESHSEKYNLDPVIVENLIIKESELDPNAISEYGARGLGQILHATAQWCAEQLNLDYSRELLFEPDYNLELTCFYLNYLINEYDGDIHSALTHYNQGCVEKGTKSKYSKSILGA